MTRTVCAQLGYHDSGNITIDYSVYMKYTLSNISNRSGGRVTSEWCRKICYSE